MNESWQAFLDSARAYISEIESDTGEGPASASAAMHETLLELQFAALDLPETAPNTNDPAMVTEAKRADRAAVRKRFDFRYRMPDQVLVVVDEPCEVREVSEDLCDIYDELQDILALDAAGYQDEALWQARGGYVEDWGYLVVSVQAALWKFVAEAAIEAEEAAEPD